MRVVVIKAFGKTKEYYLNTSIKQIEYLKSFAEDFEIIEYKADLGEQ